MKRVLVALVLSISTFFAFGLTPVFAKEDSVYIEPWQSAGFIYWFNYGFMPSFDQLSDKTTYLLNASESSYIDTALNVNINTSNLTYNRISCLTSEYSNVVMNCYAYVHYTGEETTWFDTPYYINQHVYSTQTSNSTGSLISNDEINVSYKVPWLNKSDTFVQSTSYNSNKATRLLSHQTVYLAFYTNILLYNSSNPIASNTIRAVYTSNGNTNYSIELLDRYYMTPNNNGSGLYFYIYSITNTGYGNNDIYIDFGPSMTDTRLKVMPVYYGSGNDLTNDQKSLLGLDTSTDILLKELINGNNPSKEIISNSNSTNQQYESINTQIDNLESQVNADFNSRIDNIPTSSSLLSLPKLVASANWVRERFNELNVAPFSIMLEFSLILGIALIFLGKIR